MEFVDRLVEMVGVLVGFSWFNFNFVRMVGGGELNGRSSTIIKAIWDAIPLAIIWFVWKTRKKLLLEVTEPIWGELGGKLGLEKFSSKFILRRRHDLRDAEYRGNLILCLVIWDLPLFSSICCSR